MKVERLQKILAASGIASRRAAETMIEEGRVRVNGRIIKELGAKADPRRDRIELDGVRIVAEKHTYVVLHKPRSVVSTMSDPEGRPTVQHYLDKTGARVVPVGRLDFATSGVLLATNDGDFSFTLLHPKQKVPKTYVLKVTGEMKEADLEKWRTGVELDDGMTRPAEAKLIRYENGKTWLELTITEGRNQMIRRMGEKTGFYVMRLARMSFAGISSEGLPPGKWRMLTREELLTMKKNYGVPKTVHAQAEAPAAVGRHDRGVGKSTHGAFGGGKSHRTAPQPGHDRDARGPNTHARRGGRAVTAEIEDQPKPDREARAGGRRDRAPNPRDRAAKRGDRPAPTRDRPPAGNRDRAATGNRDRAPSGNRDRAATGSRDRAPSGNRERAPAGNRERAPSQSRDRAPHAKGRNPREKAGDSPKPMNRGASRNSTAPASRSAQWKSDETPREPYGLGRGGRTRTTGTAGGVGGGEGDYRMQKTRRGGR